MSVAGERRPDYPVRVIYLGGLGRSGSTLLERLLGELPGVCASGEIVHLWQRGVAENERCGCGLEFSACDFWKQVGKEAFGGWDKIDASRIGHLKDAVDRTRMIPRLSRQKLPPRLRSDLAEYSGYYVRVYRAHSRRERMRRHRRLEQARLSGVLPEHVLRDRSARHSRGQGQPGSGVFVDDQGGQARGQRARAG